MKLNIMNWNTGITEFLDNKENCSQIIEYIKGWLCNNENAIAFLQQIVYKDSSNEWKMHEIFTRLQNEIISEGYEIKFYKRSSFMMTIAIAKKGTMKLLEDEKFYPKECPMNRAIAVKFNGISFLSIHAQSGEDNKPYLEALPSETDFVLGDFNAGNYPDSENRETFNEILKDYICICNMPTKINKNGRRTCIDHIFVKTEKVTRCANLIVHEEIQLSDHFPITFEFNLEG